MFICAAGVSRTTGRLIVEKGVSIATVTRLGLPPRPATCPPVSATARKGSEARSATSKTLYNSKSQLQFLVAGSWVNKILQAKLKCITLLITQQ